MLGDATRHLFRNSKVLPFFARPMDGYQITVEPEPPAPMLGVLRRPEDWFDISPGLGVKASWTGNVFES
jgi:hypothetical protein